MIAARSTQRITPQIINASLQEMKVTLSRPITKEIKTFIARASAASSARRNKKFNG